MQKLTDLLVTVNDKKIFLFVINKTFVEMSEDEIKKLLQYFHKIIRLNMMGLYEFTPTDKLMLEFINYHNQYKNVDLLKIDLD